MIKLPDQKCKKLKYLIVVPRIMESEDLAYLFPTGLAYVSSALKASGREVLTLNLNYKRDYIELLQSTIADNKIDVVATGGVSGQYSTLRQIIDAAKLVNPDVITIVGGGIVTAEPEVAIEALENADYCVTGEGEITINALAYALETGEDASEIIGVIVKSKNNNISPPTDIADLDCLPFPDYEGLELREMLVKKNALVRSRNNYSASVIVSRSCPWSCTFCFHPAGSKYRRRSLDNLFEEIDWLIESYGVERFSFSDELFVDKSEFIYKFCERIKPYNVKYWAQTRVDMMTKEIAQRMKDSGCYAMTFGVESADEKILKSMRKFITVRQIENAFDIAIEAGMMTAGSMILGDLEETPETISNSLNWMKQHPNYPIEVFWILTFPGSYLYKKACERGIIQDRVRYLRDEQFRINVSRMTDAEYTEMIETVDMFNLMRSENMEFNPDLFRTKLEEVVESGKTAVWPAVTSNIGILRRYAPKALDSKNLWLINSHPSQAGVHISDYNLYVDKKIYVPDIIPKEGIETIVFLFSIGAFEVIRDSINNNYPSVKRILRIGDLLK